MELNSEQTQKIADMLGEPKVKWSRAGAFFCSMRTPEMDALVDAGALRVEETIEPWGPCVTYVVTDGMRNRMAAVMLSTNVQVVRLVEKSDDGCGSFRPRRQHLQGAA